MHPQKTYELKVDWQISLDEVPRLKKKVIDFLMFQGVESFVEGSLDVDINQNQDEPPRDHYGEMGGDGSPMSVYRYSRESLEDLRHRLTAAFGSQINMTLSSMDTSEWMDGWKDSFKPFATELFFVRPPWELEPAPAGLMELIIEPGMAFGTGQHATTKLCLHLLAKILADTNSSGDVAEKMRLKNVLDVGTGTGILAIAAKKCGYGRVVGSDIEEDAILAAKENSKLNSAEIELYLGTFPRFQDAPSEAKNDLLFANILAVVILRLLPELVSQVKTGGYLIFSGILASEAHEVVAAAHKLGLRSVESKNLDDWAALLFQK